MPFFSICKDNTEVNRFNITKKLVSIGRATGCDLVLNDPAVSQLHATIIKSYDGVYRLIDPGSTNGVFIKGNRIQEHELHDGDEIVICSYTISYSEKDNPDSVEIAILDEDYISKSQALLSELRNTADSESVRALKGTLEELDRALSDAHKAHERLTPLLRMAEQTNSPKGIDSALIAIIEIALKAIGMERGAVLLFDDEKRLQIRASIGFGRESGGIESSVSMSVVKKATDTNIPVIVSDIDEASEIGSAVSIVAQNIRATVCLPLRSRTGKTLGALYMDTRLSAISKAELSPDYLTLFALFAATAIQTRQLSQREKELEEALTSLRDKERRFSAQGVMDREKESVISRVKGGSLSVMLGKSDAMEKLYGLIKRVAATEVTILITGETGTGKGVAAKVIHDLSNRKDKPFVTIDCASIPSELLESELFGYERGAFTGAVAQKKGRVELADGGTLFLDEIGDMPLGLQAKLLRFIQEKSFERVGGNKTMSIDVRVIAATNKELKSAVANKLFREDLYYRLCGVQLSVPPLRERGEDAYYLALCFMDEVVKENSLQIKGFTPEARNAILSYSWQGNIRQLKNVINRSAILCTGEYIDLDDLGLDPDHFGEIVTLKDAREESDKRVIQQHLLMNRKNLSKAARTLDIDRGTLRELMKKYGITESEE